jgi:hypothetical protein
MRSVTASTPLPTRSRAARSICPHDQLHHLIVNQSRAGAHRHGDPARDAPPRAIRETSWTAGVSPRSSIPSLTRVDRIACAGRRHSRPAVRSPGEHLVIAWAQALRRMGLADQDKGRPGEGVLGARAEKWLRPRSARCGRAASGEPRSRPSSAVASTASIILELIITIRTISTLIGQFTSSRVSG